jgi:type IV pilus assembly protein PilX
MMLVVLSVIVINTSRTTILQQKMAGNLRAKELANQAAESALKEAEKLVMSISNTELLTLLDEKEGFYTVDFTRNLGDSNNWNELTTMKSAAFHQVQEKPVYIVEKMPPMKSAGGSLDAILSNNNSTYYRITVKAKGGTASSLTILQSMIKK